MSDERNIEGATQMDAPSRTEDQMLADILRGRGGAMEQALGLEPESLPEASDVPTPAQVEEVDDRPVAAPEDQVVEDPVQEETISEDDTSTQPDVYNLDDLDNFSVNVKIDGEETPVSLDELVKGYATNQSLSNKGRELGDARKQLEEERTTKLSEIDNVLGAATKILNQAEETAAKEYHSYDEEIAEARKDGDTYRLTELKDKKEVAQNKYWEARKEREQMVEIAAKQKAEIEQSQWNEQLQKFQQEITDKIPDWSEEVAGEIRQFALDRGIPEEMLSTMVDVNVIKFVDEYRRSEAARSKGAVKRTQAPTKVTPVKRGQTPQQKNVAQNQELQTRVLSGQGSKAEQDAFLRNMVSKHFE